MINDGFGRSTKLLPNKEKVDERPFSCRDLD